MRSNAPKCMFVLVSGKGALFCLVGFVLFLIQIAQCFYRFLIFSLLTKPKIFMLALLEYNLLQNALPFMVEFYCQRSKPTIVLKIYWTSCRKALMLATNKPTLNRKKPLLSNFGLSLSTNIVVILYFGFTKIPIYLWVHIIDPISFGKWQKRGYFVY